MIRTNTNVKKKPVLTGFFILYQKTDGTYDSILYAVPELLKETDGKKKIQQALNEWKESNPTYKIIELWFTDSETIKEKIAAYKKLK